MHVKTGWIFVGGDQDVENEVMRTTSYNVAADYYMFKTGSLANRDDDENDEDIGTFGGK